MLSKYMAMMWSLLSAGSTAIGLPFVRVNIVINFLVQNKKKRHGLSA
jgi:hypothetical protein